MARYVTTQPTDWTAEVAYSWMADLRHLAVWDPSITSVEQVEGDGPAVGAEYDVTLHAAGGERTMRYRIEEMDRSARTLLAVSETPVLTSYDRISVEAGGGGGGAGAEVTYDADLVLKGPLKVGDPLLEKQFRKMGDEAADGLRRELAREAPPTATP